MELSFAANKTAKEHRAFINAHPYGPHVSLLGSRCPTLMQEHAKRGRQILDSCFLSAYYPPKPRKPLQDTRKKTRTAYAARGCDGL
jgi:hypothetical protein